MSSKLQARKRREADSKQRPPRQAPKHADQTAHSTRSGAPIQRTLRSPRSLTHHDVPSLHRRLGNQTVGRLLTQAPQDLGPGRSDVVVQREQAARAPHIPGLRQVEPEGTKMPVERREKDEGPASVRRGDRSAGGGSISRDTPVQRQRDGKAEADSTSIPSPLRTGLEALSGRDLSMVRVHYNSSEPARVNALAYTQGQDIYIAPGQKRHLPHEGWHAAQQMQRRLKPTVQDGGVSINDDERLEREADVMGARALQARPPASARLNGTTQESSGVQHRTGPKGSATIQRKDDDELPETGPGPVTKGAGDVSVYIGRTTTAEAGLREVYRQGAREISDEALRMVAQGTSVKDAARWATQARNDLKVRIRMRGSPIVRGLAEARNVRKYGNKVGPSYEQLIRERKTPEDIIGSAGEANQKVNRIATKLKVGGRFFIGIDIAIVTWEVISAEEGKRLRTAVGGATGIAGAAGGAWAGAKGGAAVGSIFGPVGTAIGGGIGAIGGALLGGWLGRKAGEETYDLVESLVNPPSGSIGELQMMVIDAKEDQYIRSQTQRRQ